ncbi:MAG: DUF4159 domain-containing protein [Armatimonadota bacterium]
MRSITCLITVVLVWTILAMSCPHADAQAFLYAGKRRKINCGVVWLSVDPNNRSKPPANQSVGAGMDASGYPINGGGVGDIFYLLDMRVDLKPPGWSFDNPLAPGGPATGLSKSDPVYWQVDLSADPDLSRMHVLYLPAHGTVTLTPQQREALRKFVDGGGVLWIDNEGVGGQLDFSDTFFILNFKFEGISGSQLPYTRHHPLLSSPYWLNDWEIANLGVNAGSAVCVPGYDPGFGGGWGAISQQPVCFDVLYPVVGNTNGGGKPSVAANAYGSGRIVATATYVGRGCYFNNPASLKFAYNVIAWSASWTHLRKDPRHSGSSIDTVGGTKLLELWSLPVLGGGSGSGQQDAIGNAPVIYKNVVFYTVGGSLYALDLYPQEDLDHDGNPDDGFPDVGPLPNRGQDVVWVFESQSEILSPPTIVTAQDPANPAQSIEVVLVASSGGAVYMLPAFPVDGQGRFVQTGPITPILTVPAGEPNPNPTPPLYINGWIYVIDGTGRLRAYNPSLEAWVGSGTGRTAYYSWAVPTDNTSVVSGNAEPRTGPAFGYVTSETGNAVAGMLYWFAGPWQSQTPLPGEEQNDHVYAVPVTVANDRVRIERISPSGRFAECRISYSRAFIADYPEPVAYIRVGSSPLVEAVKVYPNARYNGDNPPDPTVRRPGHVVVESPVSLDQNSYIYVTYSLDYASPEGINYSFGPSVRQPLEPRSNSQNGVPQTTIVSTPALGPDNMIFLAGKREGTGNPPAIYGLRNDGNNQISRWIYLLHGGVNPGLLSGHAGSDVFIPGVVYDPKTGASMVNPQVYSSPAVWQDKVFVAVSGDAVDDPFTGKPAPTAALLCFKANSDFVIRLTESVGYGSGGSTVKKPKSLRDPVTGRRKDVKLWQPNLMAGSATPLTPLQMARPASSANGVSIDYDKGTITFDNFDKMKLLGGPLGVQLTNCFSPSLPVWVFVDNVEVPIDWSTWAPVKNTWSKLGGGRPFPSVSGDSVDLSGWNNLLWFFVVPPHPEGRCKGIHSSPVVIGNNVYFICDDGYVYAFPTEPGEASGGPADANLLVWQGKISDSTSQLGGTANLSIAGSNGILLIPTARGLHAYVNATTLVADSNRLVETDGAGEISWSLSSISWTVSIPQGGLPMMTSGPVNKPAKVKYLSANELLVVNTGANQVCRIDKSGNAGIGGLAGKYIRGIYDRFVDPKNLLRPGQPTYLSGPTDAIFWQEYEKEGNATRRVDHCIIADSGNHRVVDLVYRFELDSNGNPVRLITTDKPGEQPDPATGFYLPELNWVSVTESINERYIYECIQLVTNPDGSQDVYAAVSNYRGSLPPNAVNVETLGLGGAIFALRYRLPTSNGWNYAAPDSGRIIAACDRIVDAPGLFGSPGNIIPLACPRFFQVIDRPTGRNMIICDNYGVYEIGPLGTATPPIRRALTDQIYRSIPREMKDFSDGSIAGEHPIGVPLMASSVQELKNGNWLITNSYSGYDTSGMKSFSGEVFELSWRDDGVTIRRIEWCTPSLYVLTEPDPNNPSIKIPLWDTWKQRLENSYILQQPMSAMRQM